MATYRIKAPDGTEWDVTAPEGATQDAVLRYAQAQWKAKPKKEIADWKPAAPTEGMSGPETFAAGMGKRVTDWGQAIGQMTGLVDQKTVDETKRLDEPLMGTVGGNLGSIAADLIPALTPLAATVKGAAAVGAGLSALHPVAGVNTVSDLIAQKAKDAAIGGAFGAAGAGAAQLIGKGRDLAASRASSIAEKVKSKAAADAAAETASARSLAGRTAQDAYKQLEHLRELNAVGALTPEQAALFKGLSEELAKKAQEKLIPSAAMKKEAAQAYKEAMATEEARAAALAAEKLSGREAKSQAMARLKRYGPAAVGGAIGHALFPGLGAIGGAATGLVLRPAIHSMRRLAQNPAVQYQVLRPIGGSGLLGDLSDPRYLGLLAPALYGLQE